MEHSPCFFLFLVVFFFTTCFGITTVHVVPHSHEDPGWLLTSDEYYEDKSKDIITNVVASLEANASRIFHYVEQVYFRRWWLAQNETKQASVRQLVAEKRLMFMTGGLCMNDEATTHHAAIIDQMTWGWRFINDTFGPQALPTVNWQIDSFGHSAGYNRLAVDMGLKFFVGQKVDFQEQLSRVNRKELEFEWTPDQISAPGSKLYAHLMWDNTRGYSFVLPATVCKNRTKPGFPPWWTCSTTPLRAENCTGALPEGNGCCVKTCEHNCTSCALALGVEKVVEHVRTLLSRYKYGLKDILMAHGSDFQWQDAPKPYKAMEMIMAYINTRPEIYNMKLIYSSPAAYFEAVRTHQQLDTDLAAATTVYTGDFLPAAFSAHYVRAGFFSSRPASKALDRVVWGHGDNAKRLRVIGSSIIFRRSPSLGRLAALDAAVAAVDAAVGVHQHHDALPGTDLMAVDDNYRLMMIEADEIVSKATAAAAAQLSGAGGLSNTFEACAQSNVSVCAATGPLLEGKPLTLVFFNPLGSRRSEIVAIPIPVAGVIVRTSSGRLVDSEVHEALFVERKIQHARNFTLFANIDIPPLGMLKLLVIPTKAKDTELVRFQRASVSKRYINLTAPGGATATVDITTGGLSSISDRPVVSSFRYYVPNSGGNHSKGYSNGGACSSAYAFLPQSGGTKPFERTQNQHLRSALGKLVQQTHAVIDSKAGVEIGVRVVSGDNAVRVFAKTGPLDISNGFGQEAVIVFDSCPPLGNDTCAFGHNWLTDANALQMVQRQWRDNATKPVTAVGTPYFVWEREAQNYYPASTIAALRSDRTGGGALTVAFNAAHGVTSPRPGALELMLHRRIVDHGCRTDEGYQMDDIHPVISELRVQALRNEAKASAAYRRDALNVVHPIATFVGPSFTPWLVPSEAVTVGYTLPANVHLHTLRAISKDLHESRQRCDPLMSLAKCVNSITRSQRPIAGNLTLEFIVRFQHLYAADEDATLSRPATVNMIHFFSQVLPDMSVSSAVETTLVAAKVLSRLSKTQQADIQLSPLQIRTFIINMKASS